MIQKESNGTYTLRYRKKDSITGKTIQSQKRGFRTKAEAKQFEATLSRENTDVIFYSLFEEYQRTLDINSLTFEGKCALIRKHIPIFLSIKYNELTKPFLLKIRSDIADLDLSPTTKNRILSVIKSTCKYAYEIYDLPDNSKVLKQFKREKKKMEIWSPEEYYRFEECVNKKYKPFFHLIYFTGLRKGEAKALTVDDLNLEEGTITINKSMRRDISSLKAPKTSSSVRKVKLDAITLELLTPLKSNEKWLFGDYAPLSNNGITAAFKRAIKKSGVKEIRVHDLRHSHCSYLVGNGIDVVSVANRLGHSNVNTTLSTYSHALENSDNKIVDFLNGVQNVSKK